MYLLNPFNLALFIALSGVSWYFLVLNKKNTEFLQITFITIIIYRIITALTILLFSDAAWWQNTYSDGWNHYQLGIILLFSLFLFRRKLTKQLQLLLTGLGSGMIIDEITDIIKIAPGTGLFTHFRDSTGDFFLIMFAFLIFASLIKLFRSAIKLNNRTG